MAARELTVNCTPDSSEVKCDKDLARNQSSSKNGTMPNMESMNWPESALRALTSPRKMAVSITKTLLI